MAVGTGYAGDVTPELAIQTLTSDDGAVLVDVRTTGEWETIGVPDLTSIQAEPIFLEWLSAPTMAVNPGFASELKAELARRGAGPETPILFLCRSGSRSAQAARAMTALGFEKSYNVIGGFEGSQQQGFPGWRAAGLPWTRP